MGERDIVGRILSVLGRPTRNGKTIYDIAFSDGVKYTTFDGTLAEKANGLVGQDVSARVKSEKKGNYDNHYLNDVAPQGQLQAAPVAAGTTVTGIPMQATPVSTIPIQQGDPEKDAKIAKAVAVKAAVPIVAALFQGAGPETLPEALETLETASKSIYGLLTGSQGAQAVVPAEQTPEAVAAAVNEAAGQEVVAPGAAIPWQ